MLHKCFSGLCWMIDFILCFFFLGMMILGIFMLVAVGWIET